MSPAKKKDALNLVSAKGSRRPRRSKAVAIQHLLPHVSGPVAKLLAEVFESDGSATANANEPNEPLSQTVARGRERLASRHGGQFAVGLVLTGNLGSYRIRKLLRRGDHCDTYLAEMVESSPEAPKRRGTSVVIKNPRVPEDMSDHAAADRLATLVALFNRESEELRRLAGICGIAQFLDRGDYAHVLRSASRPSVFVVQEYIAGDDLRQYTASHFAVSGRFSGIRNAKVFFSWARRLTKTLHQIHERLVVHGSICPDNIRVSAKGELVLVDLGEALFSQVMNDTANLCDRLGRYRSPERTRSVGSDLFSLGGVLHYLATGDDPPKPYEDIEVLKQQVRNTIRANNEPLFKASCGVADIVARCLRYSNAGRVANAAAVLGDIDIFDVTAVSEQLEDEVAALVQHAKKVEGSAHSMLRWMGVLRAREFASQLTDMAHGTYDMTGDADDMRGSSAKLLSILDADDEFITISIPRFWAPENIGIDGRFMSKTKEAVQRGVTVRRVFLIDEAFTDEHLEEIVAAHQRISIELGYPSNHSVRFRLVSATERDEFLKAGRHFGLFLRRGSPTAMFPQYRTNGTLQALCFRTDAAIVGGLRRLFEEESERSIPLADLTLPAVKVG